MMSSRRWCCGLFEEARVCTNTPVVLEYVVPDEVVLEPQPVMDELVVLEDELVDVPEANEDIEPVILAHIVILEMDDEDLDKDKKLEMDLVELDQMEKGQIIEDIAEVVLGPHIEIV